MQRLLIGLAGLIFIAFGGNLSSAETSPDGVLVNLKVQGQCKGVAATADVETEAGRTLLEQTCAIKKDKCACSRRALYALRSCDGGDCGRFLSDDPNGPVIAFDSSSRKTPEKPMPACSPGSFRRGKPNFAGGSLWCETPRFKCKAGGPVWGRADAACGAGTMCSNSGMCFPLDDFEVKKTNAPRGALVMYASECASGKAVATGTVTMGTTFGFTNRKCR